MPDIVPTRSAYLELEEERRGMQDGYRFLDEKRLVLAGELIAALQRYEQAKQRFEQAYKEAISSLKSALEQHGLEELQAYPTLEMPQAGVNSSERRVLGVDLLEAGLNIGATQSEAAVFPSPEAETCRRVFQQLMAQASALAAHISSLQRLWIEYRRTARRARALEDVLLPEIAQTLRCIDTGLEELDREEAVRIRHFKQIGTE